MYLRYGLLLVIVLAMTHAQIDDSAPQSVNIVGKPRTTSAEFQVKRIHGTMYKPCQYGHAVQYRSYGKTGENEWQAANITDVLEGKFMIGGLKAGEQYEVRVACKDGNTPARPGIFSVPKFLETPFTNHVKPSNPGQAEAGGSDDKDKSITSMTLPSSTLLLLSVAGFRFLVA